MIRYNCKVYCKATIINCLITGATCGKRSRTKRRRLPTACGFLKWWTGWELDPRPLLCKSSVLPLNYRPGKIFCYLQTSKPDEGISFGGGFERDGVRTSGFFKLPKIRTRKKMCRRGFWGNFKLLQQFFLDFGDILPDFFNDAVEMFYFFFFVPDVRLGFLVNSSLGLKTGNNSFISDEKGDHCAGQ